MSRRTLTSAPNPHQAPPVSAATRRDLFGTMGALLLLTAAEAGPTKAAELDGELLSCCADAWSIRRQATALIAGPEKLTVGESWDKHEDLVDQFSALFEHAATLPARTPEGMQAKARVVLALQNDREMLVQEIAASLARDVLERAGA